MTAAVSWLTSQRGLLLLGLSLTIGGVLYLFVASWVLWRVRGKTRDLVDLLATGAFAALTAAIALSLETYRSALQLAAGAVVAGAGYAIAYVALHAVENTSVRR